mmetsp:Transcript_33629/g.75173  ORF Transcript_33629/g.75173 Transcript_33629/m.75173 type:complete len:132 (-) Transcript_33629:439-834(-)
MPPPSRNGTEVKWFEEPVVLVGNKEKDSFLCQAVHFNAGLLFPFPAQCPFQRFVHLTTRNENVKGRAVRKRCSTAPQFWQEFYFQPCLGDRILKRSIVLQGSPNYNSNLTSEFYGVNSPGIIKINPHQPVT